MEQHHCYCNELELPILIVHVTHCLLYFVGCVFNCKNNRSCRRTGKFSAMKTSRYLLDIRSMYIFSFWYKRSCILENSHARKRYGVWLWLRDYERHFVTITLYFEQKRRCSWNLWVNLFWKIYTCQDYTSVHKPLEVSVCVLLGISFFFFYEKWNFCRSVMALRGW